MRKGREMVARKRIIMKKDEELWVEKG